MALKLKFLKEKGFESVVVGEDTHIGFTGIIAVHSIRRGPSLGGIRMRPYPDFKSGLYDVLSLAKAMSLKAAISHLSLGGGKAVIFGAPNDIRKPMYLNHMAEMINVLKGSYIAAEDSGIHPEDMNYLRGKTPFVTGATRRFGGSGDPSPATAWGICTGMQAGLFYLTGQKNLKHVKIWIQGGGKVGGYVCQRLVREGALVSVSDIDDKKVMHLVNTLGVVGISNKQAMQRRWDIFSPCAFGGVMDEYFVSTLKASMVAGGANNQFHNQKNDSVVLMKRNVLHAPDFVINAGGLLHLYVKEILKQTSMKAYIQGISKTLPQIWKISADTHTPPIVVAEKMARQLLL